MNLSLPSQWMTYLCLLVLLSGCGSPGRGNEGDDDDGLDSGVNLEVDWPFLEMAEAWTGGDLVFPTALAHLMGEQISAGWWSADFASIRVENTGEVAVSIELSAALVGYSTDDSELVELEPGDVEWVELNPSPSLSSLYGLSSEVTAQALVEARTTSGGLLAQESESVRVATRRDVFFALDGQYSYDSMATLVRPDATEVLDAFDDAVEYSDFGGTIGMGGYRAESSPPYWPNQTSTVAAGSYAYWPLHLEAGRSVTFSGVSNGADTWLFLMDSAEFANLQAGGEFLVYFQENIESVEAGSFTAPTAGWYYLVARNYSSVFSETVTWNRSMTRADNVLDYLQIIYSYLQDEGINYINVLNNFFDVGSQQILLPDEVIALGGGNCIDGSILFASLLELMGVRPVIVLAPGHAWVGVMSAPSGGLLWPIETTSMGSGTPWSTAVSTAIGNYDDATDFIFIDEAREIGLTPMPL